MINYKDFGTCCCSVFLGINKGSKFEEDLKSLKIQKVSRPNLFKNRIFEYIFILMFNTKKNRLLQM